MAGESDGIITLVKEAASDFGQLVADHIRLARVEMTADAKGYARGIGTLAIGAFILAMGYGLACIACGLALATIIGGPLAFAALALLHLIAGGIAFAVMVRKMKGVQLMHETKLEVSRSVDVLGRSELFARTH